MRVPPHPSPPPTGPSSPAVHQVGLRALEGLGLALEQPLLGRCRQARRLPAQGGEPAEVERHQAAEQVVPVQDPDLYDTPIPAYKRDS